MGRAAAASGERDPFAVDEDRALAELELAWADGGYHGFSVDDGLWSRDQQSRGCAHGRHAGRADREDQGALAGDAVKPGNRAALSLVPDEPDQVPRLERFRAAHPEVVVLLKGLVPTAWVGGTKIARPTLRDLLDDLEKMFPRDAGGG